MAVRAKFRVASVDPPSPTSPAATPPPNPPVSTSPVTINLVPVVGDGSAENKAFWAATPAGSIQLTTVNPQAASQFHVGEEFYVDFTKA